MKPTCGVLASTGDFARALTILTIMSACADSTEPASKPASTAPVEDSADPAAELCTLHPDDDGDGFGAAAAVQVACDASGFVATGDDCDDADARVYPGAPERCNELDDDCDSTVDEDLSYDWYADADADGYGTGDSLGDCDPPDGYVDNSADCDDSNPRVHPGASEVCNTLDDDCDGLTDDEDDSLDPSTTNTYYADTDGDGHGDASAPVELCAVASGYAASDDDCDDTAAEVSPDAAEVCNDRDDDCDSLIDDSDDDLDAFTGTIWYLDDDGDGFGDPDVWQMACIAPTNHLDDDQDCDDTNADVHPGAPEVCNEIDDDCDMAVDDADADVDTSTGIATYADDDGDGYGAADTEAYACAVDSGRTTDATDCDDSVTAINPAATEICDTIDNDCDGDIDDDDASLDTSTASAWYRDADSDGLGDASTTTLACEVPSGYADNPDDCDDSGFDDYDGDLLQDCEDPDADGDGLSNTYDIDDLDDSLVRGPTGGFGGDGAFSSSGGTWAGSSSVATLVTSAVSGDSTLDVDDASAFVVDDEVLLWAVQGAGAGSHSFHFVTGLASNTITVEPPLASSFSSTDVVVLQRVPHYSSVTVSGALSPTAWDGVTGGAMVFRSMGPVSVSGSIDTSGLGYFGGDGTLGHREDAESGGSYSQGPQGSSLFCLANGGGGGACIQDSNSMACGGGGAYGADGDDGEARFLYNYGVGGSQYGDTGLSEWFFGSGGGGGASDSDGDGYSSLNESGVGGAGGGLVAIFSSDSISLAGEIIGTGEAGTDAQLLATSSTSRGEIGGGGGGAGGQILLVAPTVTITGSVDATGGVGGQAASDEFPALKFGGTGGDGRIRLEYTTLSGLSNVDPTPSTGTYTD